LRKKRGTSTKYTKIKCSLKTINKSLVGKSQSLKEKSFELSNVIKINFDTHLKIKNLPKKKKSKKYIKYTKVFNKLMVTFK